MKKILICLLILSIAMAFSVAAAPLSDVQVGDGIVKGTDTASSENYQYEGSKWSQSGDINAMTFSFYNTNPSIAGYDDAFQLPSGAGFGCGRSACNDVTLPSWGNLGVITCKYRIYAISASPPSFSTPCLSYELHSDGSFIGADVRTPGALWLQGQERIEFRISYQSGHIGGHTTGVTFTGAHGVGITSGSDSDGSIGGDAPIAYCGDGISGNTAGEECDDGNPNNNDSCTNACENAECGDGIIWTGNEECDDGNAINTDACTNVCEDAECGDSIVWAGVEECDNNDDACVANCIDPVDPNECTCDGGLAGTTPVVNITKIDSDDPVYNGTTFTYSISITVSENDATNITVYEDYCDDVSYVSSVPSPTLGNNKWFVGDLSIGTHTDIINITVLADENALNGTICSNHVNASYTTNSISWTLDREGNEDTTIILFSGGGGGQGGDAIPEFSGVGFIGIIAIIAIGAVLMVSFRKKK